MTLIKELKSPPRIAGIYFKDIAFLIVYWVLFYTFANNVANPVRLPYLIFNFIVAILLIMPSRWNNGKRMWQLIIFILKKDRMVYKPISVDERSDDFDKI
ncbi:MAG: DUF5592 family protein [Lachnospiraceae bacterium]|nr:DUF5592 family protein [Lachnospiraceae bacterium]